MAPEQKPRWQKRLKNGYIQRETNSAGHLVYYAQPLYSMEEYDSCTNGGYRYYGYGYYSRRHGNGAPYRHPVDRRRINIPASFGYNYIQASEEPTETRERQRHPKHKVAVTSSKQGSRSHISLRDDPVEDGCALAEDTDVFLPVGGPWSARSSPASDATVEDKEVADLVHNGLLDGCEGRGTDIRLSDVVRPESAYTIRYTTRKRSAKGRRKALVECWEDDLVLIEECLEEDWELV